MTRSGTTPLLIILSLLLPRAARAQGWWAEASAGRAVHDPLAARVPSTVASLGVDYGDSVSGRWLYAAAGAPLGDPGPGWGAGGAGAWLGSMVREMTVGAALGVHAYGYGAAQGSPGGGGVTVEATPTVALVRGILRAELSAGGVGTWLAMGDSSDSRGVLDGGARLIAYPRPGVQVSAQGRWVSAPEGSWPYAGAAAQVERRRWGAWAYAGQWLRTASFPAPRTAYGAGAGVAVDARTRVELGVRQEPMDPVYASLPRRTWSVQLRRRMSRAEAPAPPAPVLPVVAGENATFRVPAADFVEAPVLVGDFSGWKGVPMTRDGDWWTATVRVLPGARYYGYRRADGTFVVPQGVPTVDDGMGGVTAVLVVP